MITSFGRWMFNALILLAMGLFVSGVLAPLLSLEKFWIFSNQISLYSSLLSLWEEQEIYLFSLLVIFSIITPILKLLTLLTVANSPPDTLKHYQHLLGWLETWGKWSMLDVFVVALLLVSVKLGAIASIKIHPGLYLFSAAVLLMQVLSFWLAAKARHLQKAAHPID